MRHRLIVFSLIGLLASALAATLWPALVHPIKLLVAGRASIADRVAEHGAAARERLNPFFAAAGVSYPPAHFSLVALKSEKRLELYAADHVGSFKFIKHYPVLAASGALGPKLRKGDRQVPEGLYRIESLNPNSRYHLSLRLDYPNDDDRQRAIISGVAEPGGDIMIHGRNVSIGCLAMGDPAAEELFVLAADAGWTQAQVVLAPVDLRRTPLPRELASAAWAEGLYAKVESALSQYPAPSNGQLSR